MMFCECVVAGIRRTALRIDSLVCSRLISRVM